MAESSQSSATLPQKRANDEDVSGPHSKLQESASIPKQTAPLSTTANPPQGAEQTSINAPETVPIDEKPKATANEDTSVKKEVIENPSTTQSTGTSPNLNRAPSKYIVDRKQETGALTLIMKAKKVLEGKEEALHTDGESDSLAKLVAQLSELLSASDLGRDAQARAIAYMNGPDNVTAQRAVWLTKEDRRKARRASRQVSKESHPQQRQGSGSSSKSKIDSAYTSTDSEKPARAAIAETTTGAVDKVKQLVSRDNDKSSNNSANDKTTSDGTDDGSSEPLSAKFKKAKGSLRPRWSWNKNSRNKVDRKDQSGSSESKSNKTSSEVTVDTDKHNGASIVGPSHVDKSPVKISQGQSLAPPMSMGTGA